MKFLIERASEHYDEVAPCEEAVYEEFYAEIWNEIIKRWTIKFDSAEELIEFTKREKRVVIDWNIYSLGLPTIIIYDYYIE